MIKVPFLSPFGPPSLTGMLMSIPSFSILHKSKQESYHVYGSFDLRGEN